MNNIYLLLGPELGEKSSYIKKLKKALFENTNDSLEEHKFYPFEKSGEEIVSIIKNKALFYNKKLIIVHNAQDLNSRQAKMLAEYCKKPSKDTTLVLLSDEINIDKTIMGTVPKSAIIRFWEMFENKKHDWLVSFFKKDN